VVQAHPRETLLLLFILARTRECSHDNLLAGKVLSVLARKHWVPGADFIPLSKTPDFLLPTLNTSASASARLLLQTEC
jgi:hypothetical protein